MSWSRPFAALDAALKDVHEKVQALQRDELQHTTKKIERMVKSAQHKKTLKMPVREPSDP